MFSEFVTLTREPAFLVPWAPQTVVLLHPSVAAFLTHCGSNSTIESIASAVPMLGCPRFADQTTNCHYIANVWKFGLELQDLGASENGNHFILKEEVDRKVKKLMATEGTDLEVDHFWTNFREFEVATRKAIAKGGSSQLALASFVQLVQSWGTRQ